MKRTPKPFSLDRHTSRVVQPSWKLHRNCRARTAWLTSSKRLSTILLRWRCIPDARNSAAMLILHLLTIFASWGAGRCGSGRCWSNSPDEVSLKIFRHPCAIGCMGFRWGSRRGRARWIEEGRKRRRREAAPACSHGSVRCRGRWRRSSSGVRGVKSFRIGRSSLFFSKGRSQRKEICEGARSFDLLSCTYLCFCGVDCCVLCCCPDARLMRDVFGCCDGFRHHKSQWWQQHLGAMQRCIHSHVLAFSLLVVPPAVLCT